ncbi:xanthine dehydrogenase family protein molybdopterin-binding subunit [Pseudohoeflea suaedae]|uniref:Xanthine dehydrogenase family protein molybdopterin-binding subunit n=1 Tax=Pseudohoeflea suaedae TaxID=877384 RepID=A0A4R5PM84_9HYPH|nr:molybdopterin cofactor-binding domain-containing protein [Pseudohoeflea suaedae]TDH37607.1 xanthine dehydrogenase family protein molybdopterin-binding subunit [Pseudohoeflea suaedae]
MSRAGTITRRTLLVGSAVIAGGVAFGVYAVSTPHANPLESEVGPDGATFNPWVKITPEKIVLIAPHADLGQGAAGMQSLLIAEEMDLEPGGYEIEFGPPSAAYWNRAQGNEAAPFMSQDDSIVAEGVRGAMTSLFKLLGMQITGGSSSTPDSFDKLREAGAIARETLKAAAAKKHDVDVAGLKTGKGAVILPDGTAIPYTDLAADAAKIAPVTGVALRDPSKWRLIGKDVRRPDIVAKSTGALHYGIDMKLDGMVHATVRLSPRRGALNGFDAAKAETMRGVARVMEITGGVAVIADNTWRAFKAAEAISFDWAPSDYPAEQDGHWDRIAASFTSGSLDAEWRNDGEVDTGLAEGGVTQVEYRAPYLAHQPLEPLNAVALVTDEKAEIWAGHQIPRYVQEKVAAITGHEKDQVIFHNQYAGGSFGHRLEFHNITAAAEIANAMRGTPVKLTLSREEDFATDYPRQIAVARGQGVARDGQVRTLALDIASPSVVRSQMGRLGVSVPGSDSQLPAGAWNAPYAVPNFRVRAYAVEGLAPTSSWRSVGASTAGFFIESFVDEVIAAAGADPLEERLRLCNWDVARGVLEAVGEMSNWGEELPVNKGRGIAMVESFGVPTAEVVEVTNTDQGIRIDKVWVAADVGRVIDPVNIENQVQGAVVWGLGHAMNCELTYSDGMAQQSNFHDFEGMRLYQCPEIEVRMLENSGRVKGVGEPPVPPAAPALANAIFAATGQRIREMPFNKHIDFV